MADSSEKRRHGLCVVSLGIYMLSHYFRTMKDCRQLLQVLGCETSSSRKISPLQVQIPLVLQHALVSSCWQCIAATSRRLDRRVIVDV